MRAGGFASQLDCAAHLMHKMWNVDRCQRIGTFYDEQIAGAQASQCLAGAQDGQRAFQPFEVETRRRGNQHARLIYRMGRAMNSQHANLVTGQFGPRAAAYVASEVHGRLRIDAICALQARMVEDVVKYFEIEADENFTFDTATIEASR